ncbi:MAG: hypothetical protein NXH95_13960 [Pseudomonadaceae bacterium]|nr:hypothetical protein [Pseudomonadaceae bacterium]
MKLLRPLHRRRVRRQSQFTVLGNEDLAAYFDVRYDQLQNYLEKMDVPFHKDSSGNIWASCQSNGRENGHNYSPAMACRAASRK